MIEVRNLTKYFGPTLAVDNVSFKVERGEIIGLLGPNGSGKTTIMRILTGFFPPTEGKAYIDGMDVAENSLATRQRIGYLPENMVLYPDLSVVALLEFGARVKGLSGKLACERMEFAIAQSGRDSRIDPLAGGPFDGTALDAYFAGSEHDLPARHHHRSGKDNRSGH